MEKMLRLKGKLRGSALQAVGGLGFTEEEYRSALQILEQRFGGRDRLIQESLRGLRQLSAVTGEANGLREFADGVTSVTKQLQSMGDTDNIRSDTLFREVIAKLPAKERDAFFEESFVHTWPQNLLSLEPWLQRRAAVHCMSAEYADNGRNARQRRHNKPDEQGSGTTIPARTFANKRATECTVCRQSCRALEECAAFLEADVDSRWQIVKNERHCFSCLRRGHRTADCYRRSRCACGRAHHRLLCSEQSAGTGAGAGTGTGVPQPPAPPPPQRRVTTTGGLHCYARRRVALRTLPVMVELAGRQMLVNAFLDGGSDTSYIREDVAHVLGASWNQENLQIATLGGAVINQKTSEVELNVSSVTDGKIVAKIKTWTLPVVCDDLEMINWEVDRGTWPHLQDIDFKKPAGSGVVDLLIGSDYPELHEVLERRIGLPLTPVAERTPLGWVCVGPIGTAAPRSAGRPRVGARASVAMNEQELLRRFWEADELVTKRPEALSDEEKLAEEKASRSLSYEDGRYQIGIPWRDERPCLPDNKTVALARLRSLEKTLRKDPDLKQKYQEKMEENLKKGYVRKVTEEDGTEPAWYLPHFPVVREEKQTSKVRIVMDAAAQYGGRSINTEMLPGPKLQQDIADLLIRFREKPYVLIGDIKEMFSQISLADVDRRFHRFLWRNMQEAEEPVVYEAIRLVFGDCASPFLAQKVLLQHAKMMQDKYPKAAEVLQTGMYVDDIMTGANSEAEADALRHELTACLKEGGFSVRRWCSNSPAVLKDVPVEDRVCSVGPNDEEKLPTTKTLGILWDAEDDTFVYSFKPVENVSYTKRGMLSKLASVFDPLGLLAPFVVRAKIGLQMCWRQGLDWDQLMPADLYKSWKNWMEELQELQLRLPRCFLQVKTAVKEKSVHIFADASEQAYGAVAYLRVVYEDNTTSVSFVAAKTRVTPLRAVSIPRLELLAAHLGLQLSQKIATSLQIPTERHTFWTDSLNSLYWIRGDSRRYKSFVANRVGEIQSKTCPTQWRYVPGRQNSADDCSRGLHASELTCDSRWIRGPQFLREPKEDWPVTPLATSTPEARKEEKKVAMSFPARNGEQNVLKAEEFSSWKRLLAVTAWVRRFIRNCKTTAEDRQGGSLILSELQEAEQRWLKQAQEDGFREERKRLARGEQVPPDSKTRDLQPYLSEDEVLRVGGRLDKSDLPEDAKHPIILPRHHAVTTLVIKEAHERSRHAGVNYVLADTRTRFWIINGREAVKAYDRGCLVCGKRRAKPATQVMASLPEPRVRVPLRAFAHCGVDLFGTFYTRVSRRATAKRYGCIFTCLSTRAVHLEMVSSLEANSFLLAFSRMTARRGRPLDVTSDNGTNFIRAERELASLFQSADQDKITDAMTRTGIRWHWNPPHSPHHGGVFEALIKSAKRAIRATIGNAMLTDEELQTALTEVESLLNARPLTYTSSDCRDDSPLTPSHFIIGQLGGPLAPELPSEEVMCPRRRWRHIQKVVSQTWQRFLREMLPNLNRRNKWTKVQPDIKEGDVVLVIDPATPRGCWPLARVERTHPGSDGHVRVAEIRLGSRKCTRPITRLCPLEIVPVESSSD